MKGQPSPRQRAIAAAIVMGMGQTDAYVQVYKPKQTDPEQLRIHAYRIAHHPAVEGELARLRHLTDCKTILSINDRLGILAKNAQHPCATAADRHACATTIKVYNETAGDQAPERTITEISGPGGAAISVISTTVVRKLTAQERIAQMREARQRRLSPQGESVIPGSPPSPQ